MALCLAFALLVMGVAGVLGQEQSAILREPAIIVSKPSTPLLLEGSRLSLSCAAYGYPLPTITWSSGALGVTDFAAVEGNDNTINIYNTTYEDNSGNVFVISILELCNGDPMYLTDITCSADNELNLASDVATVSTIPTGIYAPVIVASQNSSPFPLTEKRLSLTCAAWGSPTPQITWNAEGGLAGVFNVYTKEVKQTGGETFVVSVLELCNSSLVDYNKEYSCTANSKLDEQRDESNFILNPYVDVESIGFEFKPSTMFLRMLFSGPVDIEFINCDQRQFTYQDTVVAPSKIYTPTHPGDCFQSSEKEITFSLDEEDYVEMLNVVGLFQSAAVAWTNTLGPAYNISSGQLVVSTLEANTVRPSLQLFDMDMSEGVITLFFDSVMDFSTLDLHHLTLQAGRDATHPQVDITEGHELSSTRYGTTLCVALLADQLQYLRNNSELCNSTKTCYASLTSSLIADVHGNQIVPVAPTEPIQVSKYRPSRVINEGLLRVEVWYTGCVKIIHLYPNEVFIIRPSLKESVRSVGCDFGNNTQLTWKQGGQNGTISPFTNNFISSFNFQRGLSPENYGVFVCTWNNGSIIRNSQNYIVDENPFVGSPDGSVIIQTLYNPITLDIHYGAVNQVIDSVLVHRVGGMTNPSIEVSLEDFYLNITVGYAGVLYSLFGHYVANITSTAIGSPGLVFEFLIEVQDPTVDISASTLDIEEEQQSLSLSCTPSSPYLPVVWREGNSRLMDDAAGIAINPPGLGHSLNIDLNTHSLTSQDIVCEVMDPEGLKGVVAQASAEVFLRSGVYCEGDRDSQWNILWNRTLVGVTAEQNCPQQSQEQTVSGFAKRKCLENGEWEDVVDVSGCGNVEISDLAEQVDISLSTPDIAARDQLLSDLLQNLAEVLAPNATLLFPQDLSTSNNIVENVVSKLKEDIETRVASKLQVDIIDVVNNMLDESNLDVWMRVESNNDSSQLLQNAESYGSYVAEALVYDFINTTMYGNRITLKRHNIDVAAHVVGSTYDNIVYPADEDEASESAQVRIPAAYLSSRNATAVVNILFSNLETILPNEDMASVQPASMVLSSQVIANKRSGNNTVQLRFKTYSITGARNPRCAYWDYDARQWNTQGIETKEVLDLGSYSYQVTCESTHLTAFTVIVDTAQEDEVYELPLVGYIGGGVLVGCALISLVVFLICTPISCLDKKSTAIGLHYFTYLGFFLAAMCAGVVFLAGLSEATEERVACAVVAALLQYFFAAALCCLLTSVFLSIMIAVGKEVSKVWYAVFFVFAFGLPVVPTAISVGLLHEEYGNENFCWIRVEKNEMPSDILWANAVPMVAIATAIILTTMFGGVFNILKYIQTVHPTAQHKKNCCNALYIQANSILLMLFLCGTWASGLLMVNDIWDPSEWLFLGFTTALGVVGLFGSITFLCGSKVCSNNKEAEDESEKYWSDTRPILKETGQTQTAYALKETGKSESAYALMGVASDTSVENMMDEPAKKTENEATSST